MKKIQYGVRFVLPYYKSRTITFIRMSDKQVSVLMKGSDWEACAFGSNLEIKSTYMS